MNNTKVILCEKPSVAKEIASFIGSNKKNNGYFSGNDYIVTWAFGHLVTLDNAKAYSENPWDLQSIPIFPDTFKYKFIQNKGVKEQFKIIENLFSSANLIVNACDAGREGELIFRNIYNFCNNPCKNVQRLWISSYEKNEIAKGFQNLKPIDDYQNLYNTAYSRNQADWLIGINGTVALTKILNSSNVLSLGRVQTPTFTAVTQRYIDNKNFTPKAFFIPFVTLSKDAIEFKAEYNEKFSNIELSNKIISFDDKYLQCLNVNIKEIIEKPPLLLDLSTIQKKSNTLFDYTASKTLDIMQGLYEKHKVITYPRTDSRYISFEKFQSVPDLLHVVSNFDFIDYSNKIKLIDFNNLPTFSVNDKKISDHHAVIPTGIKPNKLSNDEINIFDLIVKHFIAAFSENCHKNKNNSEFVNSNNHKFLCSGTVINKLGWRNVFDENINSNSLPYFEKGDKLEIISKDNYKGFTKAPALFNDSSLLTYMETCGKNFDGDDIPIKIKSKGIGTQPGRAKIIEQIIFREYIKRDKKNLIPTSKGLKIFNLIKDFSISNIDMTGNWEHKLYLMDKGEYSTDKFISEIKQYFNDELYPQIKSLKGNSINKKILCPKCNKITLIDNGSLFKCSDDKCNFIFWKEIFHKKLSDSEITKLLSFETIKIAKLKNKEGKLFSANVFLDKNEDYKIALSFDKPKISKTNLSCPKCGGGEIIESDKAYGCNQYKAGCKFVVFKNISGYNVKLSDVEKLIQFKKTDLIQNFISKKKSKFSAFLILDDNFKVQFEFENKKK